MIFFGWGTKVRDVAIDATHHLRVGRPFFHIFFVFTATGARKFVLAELGDAGWSYRGITEADAAQIFMGKAPDIDAWWRFSLLGAIGLGILGGIFSAIF